MITQIQHFKLILKLKFELNHKKLQQSVFASYLLRTSLLSCVQKEIIKSCTKYSRILQVNGVRKQRKVFALDCYKSFLRPFQNVV